MFGIMAISGCTGNLKVRSPSNYNLKVILLSVVVVALLVVYIVYGFVVPNLVLLYSHCTYNCSSLVFKLYSIN